MIVESWDGFFFYDISGQEYKGQRITIKSCNIARNVAFFFNKIAEKRMPMISSEYCVLSPSPAFLPIFQSNLLPSDKRVTIEPIIDKTNNRCTVFVQTPIFLFPLPIES